MIGKKIQDALLELSSIKPNTNVIDSMINDLLQILAKKRIIIYPAGYLGRTLEKTLSAHGIETEYFIDRDANEIKKIKDIPVLEPQRLDEFSGDSVVFVSANLNAMVEQLSGVARRHNNKLTILNGFEANRLLKYPLCLKKLMNHAPFDIIECENCGFERHGCPLCMAYLKRTAGATTCENDWRSPSFTWFGYIVGQACTLKCIHCCEAIPFLKSHKFVPKDVIISDVQKVAASSRFLTFVELIGGEPFMHPDFKALVEELLEIKNIGYIKSFTNGTIVPDKGLCQVLKNPRFMLQVSNYEKQATGKLLDNIYATRKILKDEDVKYIFTEHFEWQDFSSFDLHNTEEGKLKTVFNACPLRNCNRLYSGILYRCPHQYAGIELGKLKKRAVESVDVHGHQEKDLADALEAFEHVNYIDACRYCSMPFDAPVVPAGIQLIQKEEV
ncbi:MAG: radical SAM protein [Deltaproteobacteria bacterium]|nr:radical SAM protein [Deltaproteobacteria bacterium]